MERVTEDSGPFVGGIYAKKKKKKKTLLEGRRTRKAQPSGIAHVDFPK